MQPVLLIHAMHILWKISLVSAIHSPRKWHDYLSTVVMSAHNQIHIPHRRRISKYKGIRSVRHHDLQTVRILKIHQKILHILRCRSRRILSIRSKCIGKHPPIRSFVPRISISTYSLSRKCAPAFSISFGNFQSVFAI